MDKERVGDFLNSSQMSLVEELTLEQGRILRQRALTLLVAGKKEEAYQTVLKAVALEQLWSNVADKYKIEGEGEQ